MIPQVPFLVVQVVIRGKVCPVVGYGGMNMHMIDISSVPDARVRLFCSVPTPLNCHASLNSCNSQELSLDPTVVGDYA